jgi:trimethylamine--corrinoid protein Co-methyltransferase
MKYWETASQEDLQRIHEGACQVLEEIGMRIRHKETVDILVSAGAKRIDDETVKIPRHLVERSIESAPESFRFYDRRGGFLEIGGEHHHHIPGATMTEVLDYPSLKLRPATLQDNRDLPRIIDALEFVDIAVQPVEATDAPAGMSEVLACAELLKNTSKYCWACPVKFEANQAFVDMAKAIAGSQDLSQRPIIGLLATMVPVYEIDAEACKVMLLAAREGLPVCLMGNAIGGMQGPATNAGCVVMEVAEELAGLSVVQTVRPGLPCLLTWGDFKIDMRTAEIEVADVEYSIALSVGAQLSRLYGIPSYSCPATDSKLADFQAGFEMAETLLMAMLSGINVTVNAGAVSKSSAESYEALLLHNEMLRRFTRIRRGMTVNSETLALDVQKEIGIRGDYLVHPHTLKHMRDAEEFLQKDLFDATGIHSSYPDPCARAKERWQRILREHQVAVPDSAKQAVDEVVERFARSLGQSRETASA